MGMGTVVYLHHMFDRELRVALRCRKSFMPKHFLDRAEVGALLQHVCAKGVPKGMRMNVGREAVGHGDLFDDAADAAGRQAGSTQVDKQCSLRRALRLR